MSLKQPLLDPGRVVDAIGVDRLAAAIRAEVVKLPVYRDAFGSPMWREVDVHIQEHASATAVSLRRGAPPMEAELDFVRATGIRRARQRIPLADVLNAYRAGYAAVWALVRSEGAQLGVAADVVVQLGGSAVDYFNAISVAVTEAYLREAQAVREAASGERRAAVERCLTGERRVGDPGLAGTQLDGASLLFVLVARPRDPDIDLGAYCDALAHALQGTLGRPALCAVTRQRVIALVGASEGSSPAELERQIESAWDATPGALTTAGLSTARSGLADAPAAFGEADRALRQASDDRPFVALSRARLFDDLLARADPTTMRLVPAWARDLVEEDENSAGELRDTLAVFLEEEFSVARSAKRLGVHPNTVRYRLGRIEALTGRSTRVFADLIEIVIASRLLAR